MGMLIRRHVAKKAKATEDKGPVIPTGVPSKSWKVDELRAFAKTSVVDLGEAKTKDEILAVLLPLLGDGTPPSDDGESTTEDKTSK